MTSMITVQGWMVMETYGDGIAVGDGWWFNVFMWKFNYIYILSVFIIGTVWNDTEKGANYTRSLPLNLRRSLTCWVWRIIGLYMGTFMLINGNCDPRKALKGWRVRLRG